MRMVRSVGIAGERGGRGYGTGAAISILGTFQPDTLITGVAFPRD